MEKTIGTPGSFPGQRGPLMYAQGPDVSAWEADYLAYSRPELFETTSKAAYSGVVISPRNFENTYRPPRTPWASQRPFQDRRKARQRLEAALALSRAHECEIPEPGTVRPPHEPNPPLARRTTSQTARMPRPPTQGVPGTVPGQKWAAGRSLTSSTRLQSRPDAEPTAARDMSRSDMDQLASRVCGKGLSLNYCSAGRQ